MASPIRRNVAVTVEYDGRGGRVAKSFKDAYAARRFYVRMDKAGRNPHVKAETRGDAQCQAAHLDQRAQPASKGAVAMTTETTTVETTAPVETKAPAKRAAKKAATKKAATKAAGKGKKAAGKKSAKKAAGGGGRTPADLTGNQIKVLETLNKNSKPLTRGDLAKKTGINKGWSKLLGSPTKDGEGVSGGRGLGDKGYVKAEQFEGSRSLHYSITASGKKALENAKKGE